MRDQGVEREGALRADQGLAVLDAGAGVAAPRDAREQQPTRGDGDKSGENSRLRATPTAV